VKTRFLQLNNDFFGVPSPPEHFVFVDSVTHAYIKSDRLGDKFETSSSTSPFKGKSAAECHALLKQLREDTGTPIAYGTFAILDDRSLQDETVILVSADEDGTETLRAEFEIACARLVQYLVGDMTIDEDQEDAKEEDDGVFRMRDEFIED
jgi:hypothetical protein